MRRQSPSLAESIRGTLRERAFMLGRFPAIGRETGLEGERELVITGTPYLMRYELVDDTVNVLRIRDGRRRRLP